MMLMLVRTWRRWTGRAALEAHVALLREHNTVLAQENQRLRPENDKLLETNRRVTRDLSVLTVENADLQKKAAFATRYFAGMPARSEVEVAFTHDDRRDLATWAESPAGAKLLTRLANRLDDYESQAIRVAGPAAAFALCARARGFRDAVAEVKQFTAAGPSPANHEAPEFPLPEGLEHLRG
jgi:hypothetical protein